MLNLVALSLMDCRSLEQLPQLYFEKLESLNINDCPCTPKFICNYDEETKGENIQATLVMINKFNALSENEGNTDYIKI